jgi:hypothetical protein
METKEIKVESGKRKKEKKNFISPFSRNLEEI